MLHTYLYVLPRLGTYYVGIFLTRMSQLDCHGEVLHSTTEAGAYRFRTIHIWVLGNLRVVILIRCKRICVKVYTVEGALFRHSFPMRSELPDTKQSSKLNIKYNMYGALPCTSTDVRGTQRAFSTAKVWRQMYLVASQVLTCVLPFLDSHNLGSMRRETAMQMWSCPITLVTASSVYHVTCLVSDTSRYSRKATTGRHD